ncbi:hypothetical protein ABIB45_001075 [Arthrobacter sp. UYCo732]
MPQDKEPPAPETDPDETEPEDDQDKVRPAAEPWEIVRPAKITKFDPGHWPNR